MAVPEPNGSSGPSNPPQQGEHYLHAQQTRPDPSSLPKLTLLMCHISGDPFKIKDFQKGLYLLSRPHGGKAHKDGISHTSTSGIGTVIQGY